MVKTVTATDSSAGGGVMTDKNQGEPELSEYRRLPSSFPNAPLFQPSIPQHSHGVFQTKRGRAAIPNFSVLGSWKLRSGLDGRRKRSNGDAF